MTFMPFPSFLSNIGFQSRIIFIIMQAGALVHHFLPGDASLFSGNLPLSMVYPEFDANDLKTAFAFHLTR
ncbi:MAG: hypothetical protein IJH70_05410 [Oscillospiraceae bacterium]|nr:hypothetical protein [Oscillospiraceae bacterium]